MNTRRTARTESTSRPSTDPDESAKVAWWYPILRFVLEILTGTIVFCLVGLAAVAINLFVHWLESLKIDGLVISVFGALEYLVLVCDAFLFVLFVTKSFSETARAIWTRQ